PIKFLSAVILTSAAAVGCGSEPASTTAPNAPSTLAGSAALPTAPNTPGITPGAAGTGANVPPTAPVINGVAGGPAPNGPDANPVIPPAPNANVACDAATIVAKNCQTCHGAPPAFGAPMSLMTQADFMKASPGNSAMTVAQMAKVRVNATDNKRMPPASSKPLTAAEIETLNKWLDTGATPGTACAPVVAMPMDKPVTPPNPTNDPSVTCHEFRAHAPSAKTDKYKVGLATDAYFNFTFNAPWKGTQYAKSFRAKVDNKAVLHHFLLFKDGAKGTDGAVGPSSGTHPGGQLVHGWAPGGEDLILNEEVGLELPETGFTLELHYNSKDANAMDNSGVEVCVSPNKPKNIAAISWLGTDAINGTSATGTCAHDTGMPVRILGGTPHMHVAGTHMKVEIIRANGMTEILHDKPFDFNYQVAYDYQDRELMIMPGDRIKTSCTYSKPVSFGEGTGDEMCYFFTLHYPANALTSAGLGQFIHGPNTCGVL
ncbi:MAG TPA: hypothetical protein VJR89_11825, partial [Polyangiales bacterium]|nr:hypothetical protein [Polyangiales bacterium]